MSDHVDLYRLRVSLRADAEGWRPDRGQALAAIAAVKVSPEVADCLRAIYDEVTAAHAELAEERKRHAEYLLRLLDEVDAARVLLSAGESESLAEAAERVAGARAEGGR